MKKNILLSLCLVSLISLNAYAYDCTGGVVITGVNNKQYCATQMGVKNWYAAFAWCDGHGMQLATAHELCDISSSNQWSGNVGNGECLNMVGIRNNNGVPVFTSTIGTDNKPIQWESGGNSGNIYGPGYGRMQGSGAICKMF